MKGRSHYPEEPTLVKKMSDAVLELSSALAEQLAVCAELRQLLLDEQKAMSSLDTPLLETINSRKEQVVSRQRKATDQLRNVMGRMSRQAGIPVDSGLSELLPALPKDAVQQLAPLQKQLQEVGSAVKELAAHNRAVLERFLGTINESLGFLTRILNSSNFYGANGAYRKEQTGAMIVNREA